MAYEKMKAKVRKAVPSFIQPLSIKATAAQKRGGLKALDAITELFGKGGKYWVQGDFHRIGDGFDAFCLSGAFNKVDGQHEAVARAAISVAIVELYGYELAKNREMATDEPPTAAKDIADEQVIIAFNDADLVSWDDVRAVLKRARKLLS